jgi:hypothetical protein
MGCDIHAHIELKVNGRWEHYSCPLLRRWYTLFARIADVRNSEGTIEPIAQPRGLPTDLNIVTKLEAERWGSDAHSHTWLSKDELNDLIKWAEDELGNKGWAFQHEQMGYLNGSNFLQYPESHPKEFEDVRFVCWFDN